MNANTIQLVLSLIVGLLLGAVYFGGLWLTVKNVAHVRRPWLLFLGSLILRTVLVLAGFWVIGIAMAPTGQWQRIVVCLAGFLVARFVITWRVQHGFVTAREEISR